MTVTRIPRIATLLLFAASTAAAQQQPPANPFGTSREYLAKNGRSGAVVIGDSLATLQIPETFRFLEQREARRFLTEAWGNPPQTTEGVLGLLLPASVDAFSPESWGVIISFDEDGYVEDDDAGSINYTDLLGRMQESATETNAQREAAGYPSVQLIGWAAPPRYDQATHKLYWAKELQFSSDSTRTLNYNVRVLGRRGVLVLNAVASMTQLPVIEQSMQSVIGFTDFNAGHRYADYVHGSDRKAEYGLAGLIAGAAAVKLGLFKGIWIALLAAKKFIIIGVIALIAVVKRFLGKGDSAPAKAG